MSLAGIRVVFPGTDHLRLSSAPGGGEVQFQDIVIDLVYTNTILGHTNSSGHKQYMCTPSGVATNSTLRDSPLLQEVGGGHKQYTCTPNL